MGKSEENSKYVPLNYIQNYMKKYPYFYAVALYLLSTNKFKKRVFLQNYNILMDVDKISLHFYHKKCRNIVIKDLKLTENHYFTNMDRLDDILGCKIHFFQISKKNSIKDSAEI